MPACCGLPQWQGQAPTARKGPVRAGELLRGEDGVVWATIDGEARDIPLDRGDVHRVERDGTMRVCAFGPARLEVYGNGPLRFEWPRHEAGGVLASVLDAVVTRLHGAWPGPRADIAPAHAA